jgi:hypothetical protein
MDLLYDAISDLFPAELRVVTEANSQANNVNDNELSCPSTLLTSEVSVDLSQYF